MAALQRLTNERPPRTARRIILRMSQAQAERVQAQAERVQREHPEQLEPPPAVRNAPGTPATIRRVPQREQSDFRLPPLPVEGQEDIQEYRVLNTGDPYALMNELGLLGDQNDPILYSSPDTALVTNIRMDDFSPIYHNVYGYSGQPVLGQVRWDPDTISDINEFLSRQVLGGARTTLFYSEPLRF